MEQDSKIVSDRYDMNEEKLKRKNAVALYGLGTETERFITEIKDKYDIVCLLDGYRQDGEMYGYPIMSIDGAIEAGVKKIIVVARPGSCKVIARRIKEICIANDVTLLDVRGKDLLDDNRVIYDFKDIKAGTRTELLNKIDDVDVVSFDLFDTLIMRKVFSYTDIFELLELKLEREGIYIGDFAAKRLALEKELSVKGAPKLEEIYSSLSVRDISAKELAQQEWEVDRSVLAPREAMDSVFSYAIEHGKRVFITTDCYYPKEWIVTFLKNSGINGYEDILVSCELGVSKNQGLFDILKERAGGCRILHIGDDEYADIEMAQRYGVDSFRIYSAKGMYEYLGELGMAETVISLPDRVKMGLFVSHFFADPFLWEIDDAKLFAKDAYDIGYLFCAPMITDFTLWMKNLVKEDAVKVTLLCARDGYLLKRLINAMEGSSEFLYFLTSRTAAIRAGVKDDIDISYVDSMKFFGDPQEELRVRYGITEKCAETNHRANLILERSTILRENYRRYGQIIGVPGEGTVGVFDFVAKGTSQMFLRNVFDANLRGYYFLQLEPEFMSDKALDIKPFYSEEERTNSEIFNSYYILETILTSPDPSVIEFDQNGNPVFDKETRSDKDIKCVLRAQSGIEDFFKDFIRIFLDGGVNNYSECINKRLDEKLLSLIGKVDIIDEDFKALVIEDPFFGRMTSITDVIGE